MSAEEKGFVIKDKRSFNEEGALKDEKKEEEIRTPQEEKKPEPPKDEARRSPLPEVNFNSLIFSLSSSALLHIGELADPQTGKKTKDLPLAKHSIDILAMLKEKTKGNLDEDERKFLDNILTDLRLRYVQALKK